MAVRDLIASVRRWFANTFSADPANERIWSSYDGANSLSGEYIDADAALKLSTAWAGVHLIANSIGMLPMGVYERLQRGRREAREHPLWDLLHTQSNASMAAGEFKAMLTANALLRGDGYAEIVPGPRGPVDQLWPIHPDRMEKVVRMNDYTLRYWVKPETGIGPAVEMYPEQIFHLRGLTLDGVTGVSFVRYGVESLGLARSAEAYAARVFKNDATPRGTLEHPGKLSPDATKRLKETFEAAHSGPNQHRITVLEEGMKFSAISMSPEDTQMLSSREYQDVDIARWLGIPLFLLQIMTKSTSWGSGLEQMWEVFKATGLGYWATRWEQATARDLISAPQKYYVKINLSALMKAAVEQRYAAYTSGITAGFMTRNEARELEDWNPIDGLDEPLAPLNMGSGNASKGDQRGADDADASDAQDEDSAAQTAQTGVSSEHYQALLLETARRVVRKEIAALTKAARRVGDDFEAFEREVNEFYSDHAEFCAQTLQMDRQAAEEYVQRQKTGALLFGVPAVLIDETQTAVWLATLAEAKTCLKR